MAFKLEAKLQRQLENKTIEIPQPLSLGLEATKGPLGSSTDIIRRHRDIKMLENVKEWAVQTVGMGEKCF